MGPTMNTVLDFVFVHMAVETAEVEWREFLVTRNKVQGSHQVAFIPAIAGSFLVSNEIGHPGLIPAIRKLCSERGVPTSKLLKDFLAEHRLP
jgi:hypothetical protein